MNIKRKIRFYYNTDDNWLGKLFSIKSMRELYNHNLYTLHSKFYFDIVNNCYNALAVQVD